MTVEFTPLAIFSGESSSFCFFFIYSFSLNFPINLKHCNAIWYQYYNAINESFSLLILLDVKSSLIIFTGITSLPDFSPFVRFFLLGWLFYTLFYTDHHRYHAEFYIAKKIDFKQDTNQHWKRKVTFSRQVNSFIFFRVRIPIE